MTYQDFQQDHPEKAREASEQFYADWGDVVDEIIMDHLPPDHPKVVMLRGKLAESRLAAMEKVMEAQGV